MPINSLTNPSMVLTCATDIRPVPRAQSLAILSSKDISVNPRSRITLANTRLFTLSLPTSRPTYRADAAPLLLSSFPDMEPVIQQYDLIPNMILERTN
jgi:hypothetical protein